jgi:hypothetical protein
VAKGNAAVPFTKRAVDIMMPADAANDFPVAMQISGMLVCVNRPLLPYE